MRPQSLLLLVGLGSAPLLTSVTFAQSSPPPQVVGNYERSPSPGKILISGTVARSQCSGLVGIEKCRFQLEPFREDGEMAPEALKALEAVLNYPLESARAAELRLPPLLVRVLVEMSDTFSGAQICVESGYRCSGPECHKFQTQNSRHITGEAADVVLLGVSAIDLANYALYLNAMDPRFKGRLGVGYYPNKEHVHIDVRDQSLYWVDYSSGLNPPAYDTTHPTPVEAYHKHYDPKVAPGRPGALCPQVAREEIESDTPPAAAADSTPYRWENVYYTEAPLRGSGSLAFRHKTVSFTPIEALKDLGGLR
jgi:uncharacterized protein YcbK (DUF882 family)